MDWSAAEKKKIWESATVAGGKPGTECDLTFEQFRTLIEGGGGLGLASRVAQTVESFHGASAGAPALPGLLNVQGADASGSLSRGASGSVRGRSPCSNAGDAHAADEGEAGKPMLLTKHYSESGGSSGGAASSPPDLSRFRNRAGAAAVAKLRAEPQTPTDLPGARAPSAAPSSPSAAREGKNALAGGALGAVSGRTADERTNGRTATTLSPAVRLRQALRNLALAQREHRGASGSALLP